MGFLGPGPLRVHVDHALAFARHLPEPSSRPLDLLDLGSGGGVPGLPLLLARTDLRGVLLDAAQRRVSFLVWAITELALAQRARAVVARAEESAHDVELREAFDIVVCRGFGPPAITIECAVGFLRPGGRLLISEPPERRRWPTEPLADVGLEHLPTSDDVAVFERRGPLPDSVPRRAKAMARSPLF